MQSITKTEPLSQLQILHNLQSTECLGCNGKKQPKKSHCRSCYFKLSKDSQRDLYKGFFEGYVEAFRSSLTELKAKK